MAFENGKWIGWVEGETDPYIGRFKDWFRPRYKASGSGHVNHGDTFDPALTVALKTVQGKLGIPAHGRLDWFTQSKLKYPPVIKPAPPVSTGRRAVIYTIPGTAAGWNDGPPAWLAWLLDPARYRQQGVGYPAMGFLQTDPNISYEESRNAGVEELVRLIQLEPVGTPIVLTGYSQGADVAIHVMHEFVANRRLANRYDDLKRVVPFGNPGRLEGPDFLGRVTRGGIARVRPPADLAGRIHDYHCNGDMYSDATKTLRVAYDLLTKMELSVPFLMAVLQILGGSVPAFGGSGGNVLFGSLLNGLFGKTLGTAPERIAAVVPTASNAQQDTLMTLLSDPVDIAKTLQILMQFLSTNAHARYGGFESWLDFEGTDAVRHAARGLNAIRW